MTSLSVCRVEGDYSIYNTILLTIETLLVVTSHTNWRSGLTCVERVIRLEGRSVVFRRLSFDSCLSGLRYNVISGPSISPTSHPLKSGIMVFTGVAKFLIN